jgi:hypothetical protein
MPTSSGSELKEKASRWQDKVLRLIVFFAILGCILLSIGAYFINRTFGDITSTLAPAPPPSTTTSSK